MTVSVALIILVAAICIDRRFRKNNSPPVVIQPTRMEVEITVSDKGENGLLRSRQMGLS